MRRFNFLYFLFLIISLQSTYAGTCRDAFKFKEHTSKLVLLRDTLVRNKHPNNSQITQNHDLSSSDRTALLSSLVQIVKASSKFEEAGSILEGILAKQPKLEPLFFQMFKLTSSKLDYLLNAKTESQLSEAQLEGLKWLEIAIEDVTASENSYSSGDYRVANYLAAQSAEKALKSVLVWYQIDSSEGMKVYSHHSDKTLKAIVKEIDNPEICEWIALKEAVDILTPLATQGRYPTTGLPLAKPTKEFVAKAIEYSYLIINVVISALKFGK